MWESLYTHLNTRPCFQLPDSLKILFAAAEAYPLAKVGGLGDVAGSLPKALRSLGHDVRVALPRYGMIRNTKEDLGAFPVRIGGTTHEAHLRSSNIDGVPVYLVDKPDLYDRPKVYEYEDDGKRFGFFCKALLDLLPAADFWPEVIHCNDWHSAMTPAFLRTLYERDERYRTIRTAFTIHNLQHQGLFDRDLFDWTGLPPESWDPEGVEFFGKLNFMKAGIVYADVVNAVSPTYAKEIQTKEHGYGLEALLRSRGSRLSGILNGIDYDVWNPASDTRIPRTYTESTIGGKADDKRALQKEAGLPLDPEAPLLGMVSRITEQKGLDILLPALPRILELGAQAVILGTGEKQYEGPLEDLSKGANHLAAYLTYDEALAHRIYAGSDFFLMPSRFEPCGLGQMISLRYGTVPIVRATGGLVDTVTDVTQAAKEGNGFVFSDYTPEALLDATRRAVEFYRGRRGWKALQRRAMASDLSWKNSAAQYARWYERSRGA